jgi:lysylphosphatidylglycerol synthetase-like protein (DUF2156 family)
VTGEPQWLTDPLCSERTAERVTSTWSTPSLRIHIAAVAATAMLLVFGVGGWGATAQLSGAVIAAGTLVVDTNGKRCSIRAAARAFLYAASIMLLTRRLARHSLMPSDSS